MPTVNAQRIENLILGLILRYFTFPENLVSLWKDRVNSHAVNKLESELRGHRIKLGNLESRRKKLLELFLDGDMDKDYLKKQESELKLAIERMQEEISEIENKLSEMSAMKDRLENLKGMTQEVKKIAPALNEAIKKMSNQQLREFVEVALAGQKITVRILRKGDISDQKLSAKEQYEPVYKNHSGRKLLEWTVDEGHVDLVAAAEYLRPLVNEYIPKIKP